MNVYVDGVFDLFHVSHLKFLKKVIEDATKELKSPINIICGVISDKDCESYKRTPILNENQRTYMLQHCSIVDKVIKKSPLIITNNFLIEHNIKLVYHGNDSKQEDFFKVCIEKGIMRYVSYDNEISTTKIINKIKNNY
jgi:ethanolamine-phosphate cytidylyltransferase